MRFRTVLLIIVSLTLLSGRQTAHEYQIKAVFLYNFTQFVTWPETFVNEDSPFVIGIAGPDPFGQYLEETVKDERVGGHPIVIRRYGSASAVEPCHILFISLTDKSSITELTEQARLNHTLTVGDLPLVEKQGGMIRFVKDDNKTRLRINLKEAKTAGLTISAKLLKLAEVIE